MNPRRLMQLLLPINSNLKNGFTQNYSLIFRQKFNDFKRIEDLSKKFQVALRKSQFYRLFPITKSPKNNVVKVWVYHCECVFAQRLRRCQQMFTLYSKWWEEKALRDFIRRMRQNLTRRGKEFTLASVAVYNWDKNRIPLEDIQKNEKEFDYMETLKNNTICLECDPTKRSNNNTRICKCGTTGKPTDKTYDNWAIFIEKTDLVVWRRLHPSGSGQYEYKMFGSYSDITAEDFLNVQIDIDYRRKWDTTAVTLQQGETEENSNSDIIYWELLWPRLFVNRDYVFNRRYVVDEKKKIIYIVSKSTEHPAFPKYADKYRIEDYFSCMVIRPYEEINKPGVEFILTYYDNPGVNIPSSVTTWVAMRAMPDFLDKLRDATRSYRSYCIKEGTSKACRIIAKEAKSLEDKKEKDKLDYCSIVREAKNLLIQHARGEYNDKDNASGNATDNSDSSNTEQKKCDTFFKYFHPLYYFQ